MHPQRPPTIAGLCALLSLLSFSHAKEQAVLSSDSPYICQHPPYEVHLVSSSPLVVYLSGFITPEECAHLTAATRDTFAQSAVADKGKADGRAIHKVRTSQSTNVPRDEVVRCVEERALRFQGLYGQYDKLEPLQLVKYGPAQHYHYHTDWFTDALHATAAQGGNRQSSFFAYVHVSNATAPEGKLLGGGTSFPLLNAPPAGDKWCAFIDCDEPWERGVTFRPVQGNAVYWDNLLPRTEGEDTRTGDPRTLHAGLPVVSGEKIGMNIWTREGTVPAAIRGE
ncbi:hypothetical protein Sste5346_000911 [Sporothrix stenoceras]|uniref:Fe2OG dioxygenase domain-containing protein n=1 Tax=Sporothrix stenoceras TaxID=5173 RepID=A0ABR3ZS18_9PEZI